MAINLGYRDQTTPPWHTKINQSRDARLPGSHLLAGTKPDGNGEDILPVMGN